MAPSPNAATHGLRAACRSAAGSACPTGTAVAPGRGLYNPAPRLEADLGVIFPEGYERYIVGLGEAIYAGFVRIYPPARVRRELEEWRERVAQYFFWDASAELLHRSSVVESIVIGDTLDGDEIIFHPADSGVFYVLTRHQGVIHRITGHLDALLDWMCRSGVLMEPVETAWAEPVAGCQSYRIEGPANLRGDTEKLARGLKDLRLHKLERRFNDGEDGPALHLLGGKLHARYSSASTTARGS